VEALQRRIDDRRREIVTGLERAMSVDGYDRAAGRDLAGALTALLAARAPETRLLSADCAQAACRLVLEHSRPEAQFELAQVLTDKEPFTLGTLFDYDSQASPPRTRVYVARKGHELFAQATR
jgi:hypothetical protein